MNKKIIMLVVIVLAGVMLLQAKSYNVVNNLPKGEYFHIKPKGSNLCLGSLGDKRYTKLNLVPCYRQSAKWKFKKKNNGVYNIESIRGGYLGIADIRKKGSPAKHTTSGRDVKLLAHNNTTFFIKFNVGGRVLDVAQKKRSIFKFSRKKKRKKGSKIIQWNFNGRSNQQWKFLPVRSAAYFNYKTYRTPSKTSDYNTPSKSHISLNKAVYDDFSLKRYFTTCNYAQFSTDNRNKFLENFLNNEKISKRILKVQKIIKGTMKNRDYNLRRSTYQLLTKINLKEGGFLVNMVKGTIKKDIRNAIRKEINPSAKLFLKKLLKNF